MNLKDLQMEWGNQPTDGNLIIELFRESRYRRIKSVFTRAIFGNILFALFTLAVIIYAWLALVENFSVLPFTSMAILILALSYVVFYKNISQLGLISKISHTRPIVEQQQLIGKLKISRVRHNRFLFIFSNLYCWSMFFLIFGINPQSLIQAVWLNAPVVVIIHLGFAIAWFPLAFWILKKYDQKDSTGFWRKLRSESMLTDDSLNFSLNNTLTYLEELKSYEKE